jgi:SAM-dependent methyltransferase
MENAIWFNLVKSAPRLDLVDAPCPTCRSCRNSPVARGVDFEYRTCSNEFSFVRCAGCSTVFLNPRPRVRDLGLIYPTNYYSFVHAEKSGRYNPLVQKVWDLLERKRLKLFWSLLGRRPRRILDMGCGTGRLLTLLRKYGYPEWQLVGVEFGIPDELAGERKDGIRIYKGLYEEVAFEEAPFDLIVAQQVVEHAYDPRVMLRKTYDDLAPGGYAIFDTPDFNSIDRLLFNRSYWGGYHFPRHMTLFAPHTFSRLAGSLGFEVLRCRKMLSPVFWLISVHNLLVGAGCPPKWAGKIHYQALPLIAVSTMLELANLLVFRWNSNMRVILRKPALRK